MPWNNRGDLATTAEANVISVAGRSGAVVLTNTDVGLANVDNTSDANKPGQVPIGGIIMWSGVVASIPAGWALCNGVAGTPDLRGRFIVGASQDAGATDTLASYNKGATGGVDTVALGVTQIPAHTHTLAINTDAHEHTGEYRNFAAGTLAGLTTITSGTATASAMNADTHTHTGTVSGGGSGTSAGAAVDTRNRFYALAYIMRIA